MGFVLYNIFLLLYKSVLYMLYPFNSKAARLLKGRKNLLDNIESAIPAGEKIIWFHAASLGEFEQGRPLLEKLKDLYPACKILLTFFSPSGYEVQKNYARADWVFYLPFDSPKNARRLLSVVQPALVVFIKYEYWYYYLKEIRSRGIPLLMVSAQFRKEMFFFQWYGGLPRKMLSFFDHLFVQNQASYKLLENIGLGPVTTVSGDTRFDRVSEIAEKSGPVPLIEAFAGNHQTIVAGSTWPEDEAALKKAFEQIGAGKLKLIIAPHEISKKHLDDLRVLFPGSVLYSVLAGADNNSRPEEMADRPVLIIDNIGMLSRLYRHGWITYVGGGLKRAALHNVLEPAVYGKIVLFGPHYHKFSEATGLVQAGGGIPVYDTEKNGKMLVELITMLLENKDEFEQRSRGAGAFVRNNRGATQRILAYIQEKRLLTS